MLGVGGAGECSGDLQPASMSKGNILFVSVDLPGSLEDQRDLVHLFHLGHPESNSKEGLSRDVRHHCCLPRQLLHRKKETVIWEDKLRLGQQRTRMGEILTCGPGGP